LEQVRQAAQHLVEDGYLLAEDLELWSTRRPSGPSGLPACMSAWRPNFADCGRWSGMALKGHEERFPSPRLSARCRFSQGSFAGTRGNGRDAPIPGHRKGGRPAKLTPKQVCTARKMLADPEMTIKEVAEAFGVNRATIYRSLGLGSYAKGATGDAA
jgi:Helix-turn-helix domain of resolvase